MFLAFLIVAFGFALLALGHTDAGATAVLRRAARPRHAAQMSDSFEPGDILIASGDAGPDDLHLLSRVVAVDGEIIDYLKRREAIATRKLAERRLGQMIAEQKATVGLAKPPPGPGRGNKTKVTKKPEFSENQPITFLEAGIDKNLANRARKMAHLQ